MRAPSQLRHLNQHKRKTGPDTDPVAREGRARSYFLRLWRLALMRFLYLCFDIFLRRFLTSEPMQKPLRKGGDSPYGRVSPGLGQTKPVVATGSLTTVAPTSRKAPATRSDESTVVRAMTAGPAPDLAA